MHVHVPAPCAASPPCDLSSLPPACRHLDGAVYVGLADGTLVVLDACQPTPSPRHSVVVGGGAVRACVCVMGEVWLACEGSLYRLDLVTHDLKVGYSVRIKYTVRAGLHSPSLSLQVPLPSPSQVVCSLQSHQQIAAVHVAGNGVWVSVIKSSLLHLVHAPSGVLLASIDCTCSVMQVLKRESLYLLTFQCCCC